MEQAVYPQFLKKTITVPASKSYMQRACAAALLKGGSTTLTNFGSSNDDKAAINTIQQLGATVTATTAAALHIESNFGKQGNTQLQLGESGLGLRMFTPIAALLHTEITINGHGSLTKRPMYFFDEILPLLNVAFTSNNGYLPFTLQGPLLATNVTVDGSLSSQFLTGLLMAYSYSNTDATITVTNLTSKPYIDITLDVLQSFGLATPKHSNYERFTFTQTTIPPPNQLNYVIEADWSSASFLLVAGAINGHIECKGLNVFSVQADKAILTALHSAGATMSVAEDVVTVQKSNLLPFYFDATHCPDLFPPLVALAAYASGITVLKGALRLTHKESNRAITLQQEFAKLGVSIELQDDEMIIRGTGKVMVKDSNCSSHNDHRIAMALAIAALDADKAFTIMDADAINKSYPEFFMHTNFATNILQL